MGLELPILVLIPGLSNVGCGRRLTYADSRMQNLLIRVVYWKNSKTFGAARSNEVADEHDLMTLLACAY